MCVRFPIGGGCNSWSLYMILGNPHLVSWLQGFSQAQCPFSYQCVFQRTYFQCLANKLKMSTNDIVVSNILLLDEAKWIWLMGIVIWMLSTRYVQNVLGIYCTFTFPLAFFCCQIQHLAEKTLIYIFLLDYICWK